MMNEAPLEGMDDTSAADSDTPDSPSPASETAGPTAVDLDPKFVPNKSHDKSSCTVFIICAVGLVLLVVIVGGFSVHIPVPEAPEIDERFSQVNTAETRALLSVYQKLLPIEQKFRLDRFGMFAMIAAEITMSPTVLLLGPYSTGKTTFIKHMIGMDYPDIHIGPEPTTDKFTAVLYGKDSRTISGNVLAGLPELPFSGLSKFGYNFMNKFSASMVSSPVISRFHFIDTPGILAESVDRGYSFPEVASWFGAHADLILLFFDGHKLDISDQYRDVIRAVTPYEDRISLVLNKADQMNQNALMRVYGALTRSLARTMKSPESKHIYVGSFSDEPLLRPEHKETFDRERAGLMAKFNSLYWDSSMRKISEMLRRTRKVQVLISIMVHMRSFAPYLYGKDDIRWDLSNNLEQHFRQVRKNSKYTLLPCDFPDVADFRQHFREMDFTQFPINADKELAVLQKLLDEDLPKLSQMVASLDPAKVNNA